MPSQKKIVEVVKDLFNKADDSNRSKWETTQQKNLEFFLGEQLSLEESESLQDSGMPDFIVNRITPVIEMMKFFTTSQTPRWKAVGAEGSDADVAAIHSDIADYCWNNSNGDSIYSQVIQDSLVKGIGYMQIDIDPDQDKGLGEVVFKRVEPFDVYIDPTSRDFMFRDASFIIIKKDLPRQTILSMFPSQSRKIKGAHGNPSLHDYSQRDYTESDLILPADTTNAYNPETSDEDDLIDYYEVYTKEKIKFRNLFINMPPTAEEMQEIKEQSSWALKDFKSEISVRLEEKALQLQKAVEQGEIIQDRAALEMERARKQATMELEQREQAILSNLKDIKTKIESRVVSDAEYQILIKSQEFASSVVDEVEFYESRIRMKVVAGDKLLYNEYIPAVKEYPLVPFVYQYTGTPLPQGAVSPLVGKQQELNKAHQIMIHNANLASNLRFVYEEGSVPEEEWEQYSSAPGALLKYRQGFQPPVPIQPLPLNNAFFGITDTARQDMEYISGIYSSMQGDVGQSPETYRGLLAMDEYGTRRIKSWMNNIIEPALEHIGVLFKDMAQDLYQVNKVFRIVQPNNIDEEKAIEINVPIFDDYGNAIKKWRDYSTAQFDVKIVAGSTLPVNRWALLEEYFRWFQSGLIDDIAMLKETDIRNKETILARKSVYVQLKSKVEELEQILTDREGTIETLERQLVQSGIKLQVGEAKSRIDRDVMQTEAQQMALREKTKNEQKVQLKELGMAIGQAKKEMVKQQTKGNGQK